MATSKTEPKYGLLTLSQEDLIDVRLYQAGYEACEPLHLYGPAVRNHFLFHFIVSGSGVLQSTDIKGNVTDYRIRTHEGFLISPDQVTTYYADEHNPWDYIWIEVDGLHAQQIFGLAGLGYNQPIFKPKNEALVNEFANQLQEIINGQKFSTYQMIGHVYLTLDALINASAAEPQSTNNRRQDFYVQQAIQYVENNFQKGITVEDVAAYCGLNRTYLSKIFHSAVATNLKTFLTDYRLGKACNLLKNTDNSIHSIAEQVGYTNQFHFSNAFKEKFQLSPSQWRYQHHD